MKEPRISWRMSSRLALGRLPFRALVSEMNRIRLKNSEVPVTLFMENVKSSSNQPTQSKVNLCFMYVKTPSSEAEENKISGPSQGWAVSPTNELEGCRIYYREGDMTIRCRLAILLRCGTHSIGKRRVLSYHWQDSRMSGVYIFTACLILFFWTGYVFNGP